MILSLIDTSYWIVQNIQYLIALIFGCTTILFSVAAWYIFKWLIPSPLSLIPFWSTKLISTSTSKHVRKPRNARSKGDIKPSTTERKIITRSTTTRKRQIARSRSSVFDGLGTLISSTIGSALILCSIASSLICAYSLTEKGCHTLRHLGLIEWLPWKEGLKCYKTRWDWFADLLGEVILTVLQKQDFGQNSIKGM
ncbi:uncharacterized protein L201_004479 [Kwoniella dendrophila CBS 6074]|uniref:Uncharacterized protein n=1 Tax=Kwoniella dendrophila CBS 6074 TaxID=1295534 RepID=A0AAX4JYA1_9TREE